MRYFIAARGSGVKSRNFPKLYTSLREAESTAAHMIATGNYNRVTVYRYFSTHVAGGTRTYTGFEQTVFVKGVTT